MQQDIEVKSKEKNKELLDFLKTLITDPDKIEFFAYIKENDIQSVSIQELYQHYEKTEDLEEFMDVMVELGFIDKQIIDQMPYYSWTPSDAQAQVLLEKFYENYTIAKNIFYKKAERDFYEKSTDIRRDKEILDAQVKDLEVFTDVGEAVQKIYKLEELFTKIPEFCVDLLDFQSAELYVIENETPKLVTAKYSDGSEQNLDFKEFNEQLKSDSEHLKVFKQANKEMSFLITKANYSKNKNVKNEVIITKIIEDEKISGYIEVGYGEQHKRIVDRDTDRITIFTNTISIALSKVRLFDELDKKVQQRTEELNKANTELQGSISKMEEINKEMKRELKVASNIQAGIVPKQCPYYPNVNVGAKWQSMTEVSGDYYDFIPIENTKKIGFLVVDVSGHGVPAALITTMAKVSFGAHAQTSPDSADVCKHANMEIYEAIGDIGFYLTAFFGIFDARTNELQYTNAGHQMALWHHKKTDSLEQITSDGFFIGSIDQADYGYETIKMEKGDKVMFFTDGIVEARRDPDGEFYEEERVHKFFHANQDLSGKEFAEKLFNEVEKFCNGRPPNDDRTIIVIECTDDPLGDKIEEVDNLFETEDEYTI